MHFHTAFVCLLFVIIDVAYHIRLNHTQSHIKSVYAIMPCFHCAPVPKKEDFHENKKLNNTSYVKLFLIHIQIKFAHRL